MAQPALELPGLLPSTAPLPASLCTLSQRAAVFSPEVQGSWTADPTAVVPLQKRAPHRTLLHSRCSGHCPQQGPENSQKQTQTPEFKTMPFNRQISASKPQPIGGTLGGRTAPAQPQKNVGKGADARLPFTRPCLQRVPWRPAQRRQVGRRARNFSAQVAPNTAQQQLGMPAGTARVMRGDAPGRPAPVHAQRAACRSPRSLVSAQGCLGKSENSLPRSEAAVRQAHQLPQVWVH